MARSVPSHLGSEVRLGYRSQYLVHGDRAQLCPVFGQVRVDLVVDYRYSCGRLDNITPRGSVDLNIVHFDKDIARSITGPLKVL